MGQTPRKKSGKTFKIPPVKIPSSVQGKSAASLKALSEPPAGGKTSTRIARTTLKAPEIAQIKNDFLKSQGVKDRGEYIRREAGMVGNKGNPKKVKAAIRKYEKELSSFQQNYVLDKYGKNVEPAYKKTSKKELEKVIREEVENHLIEKLKASK